MRQLQMQNLDSNVLEGVFNKVDQNVLACTRPFST